MQPGTLIDAGMALSAEFLNNKLPPPGMPLRQRVKAEVQDSGSWGSSIGFRFAFLQTHVMMYHY
jgi:hypothetical protein